MWISKLKIANYKKIDSNNPLTIDLKEGLNLLIGENNIGKTTIAEALILCLNYGSPEKYIWLSDDDFNDPSKPIEIEFQFSDLSNAQQAAFLEALVLDENGTDHKLKFNFSFQILNGRIQSKIRCGETGDNVSPYDILGYLQVIFLPALRDVNIEFRPGYKSRLGKILKNNAKNDGQEFERIFKEANKAALEVGGQDNPIIQLEEKTNKNVEDLSLTGDNNRIRLNFVEQEYSRILTNIRMICEDKKLEINTNGLGYNNLIYISTILTELKFDEILAPHKFNCLIIEEPEAHLHPQLQSLLLTFLQKEYKDIQVILTSHSPTLTSVVDLDNINILCKGENATKSILLKKADIEKENRQFLQLFLDVTKSQLFFARAIIFVEGITEAILLRAFWDYIYRSPEGAFDKQGIEIVNIQGVSFARYADLVNHVFIETKVKSVIITDDDRGTGINCPVEKRFKHEGKLKETIEIIKIFNAAPLSARAINLKDAIDTFKKQNKLIDIFLARKTLEVEIGMTNLLSKGIFEKLLNKAFDSTDALEFGIEMWKYITESDIKSDFANKLVTLLKTDISNNCFSIRVPEYICKAFGYLMNV